MRNSIESILLFIAVLHTAAAADEEIYAQVGETVILKTPPSSETLDFIHWLYNKPDSPKIAWVNAMGGKGVEKNENPALTDQLSVTHDSLTIKSINEQIFGTFICKLLKTSGVINSKTYRIIKVEVGVTKNMTLMPGEDVTLTCDVDTRRGEQKPTIEWVNPLNKKIRSNEGTLKIKAKSKDSGEWTCVVKNSKNFTTSIKVLNFSRSRGPQYASVNSSFFIPFSLSENLSLEKMKKAISRIELRFTPKSPSRQNVRILEFLPEKSFKLEPLSLGLTNASTESGNLSLIKNNVTTCDRGNYTWSITFKSQETLSHTIQVQVLEINSSRVKLVPGQQLTLNCTIGEPLASDMEVKWSCLHRRSICKTHPKPSLGSITWTVRKEDNGNWTCELWQKGKERARLVSAEIEVIVEPLLSVWMQVIIASAGLIVILLLVLAFILFRRRQRKRRHFRHRLCQCKNPKPKGFYRT